MRKFKARVAGFDRARLLSRLRGKHILSIVLIHGTTHEKALYGVTALFAQQVKLCPGFDTFGYNRQM